MNTLTKAAVTTYEQKQAVTKQLQQVYEKKINKLTSSRSAEYRVYCQIAGNLIIGEGYACEQVEKALQTEKNKHARKAYLKFIAHRNTLM